MCGAHAGEEMVAGQSDGRTQRDHAAHRRLHVSGAASVSSTAAARIGTSYTAGKLIMTPTPMNVTTKAGNNMFSSEERPTVNVPAAAPRAARNTESRTLGIDAASG